MQSSKNLKIIESTKIRDLLKHVTYKSMVILDLDNTVFEVSDEFDGLGSDQWFTALMKHASQLELKNENAAQLVLQIYHEVQKHVSLKLVEARVAGLIKSLQDKLIFVLPVTSRSQKIIEPTLTQLKKLGIDFTRQLGCSSWDLKTGAEGCSTKT